MASRSVSTLAAGLAFLLGSQVVQAFPSEIHRRVPDDDPTEASVTQLYDYQGCYLEPTKGRALDHRVTDSAMTLELCASLSGGSVYYGVEYGTECWYGDILHTGAAKQDDSKCTMKCPGNADEKCGGRMLMTLYRKDGAAMIEMKPTVGDYTLQGCYVDARQPRALKTLTGDDALTPEKCSDYCAGSTYMGFEYGRECWCADTLDKSSFRAPDDQCQMPCAGDVSALCGSPARLTLYKKGGSAVTPFPEPTSMGCYYDKGSVHRALPQLYGDDTMTVELCANYAYTYGYSIFGLEYGRECWAGNALDPLAYPDTGCTFPCMGDSSETCGGSLRLSLYQYTSTAQ